MPDLSIRPNPAVPIDIVHADADLLVVAKPSGVVTQPGKRHERDSLMNGVFASHGARLQKLGAERDWGLLHRLDKDTSGLVLVALSIRAFDHLLNQFKERRVQKLYWAIVAGRPNPAQGVIQQPIAEVVGARRRAVIRRDGEQAITAYRVLDTAAGASLIEARPKTGRLHQIRVHMAAMGCPVLGDEAYGPARPEIQVPRLCLHAGGISFTHPHNDRKVEFALALPPDLTRVLKRLGLKPPGKAVGPASRAEGAS